MACAQVEACPCKRDWSHLFQNLVNCLSQKPLLVSNDPQIDFLRFISTGNKSAVASLGGWYCVQGDWVWRWKEWLDRRYMENLKDLPDVEVAADPIRRDEVETKVDPTALKQLVTALYQRQCQRSQVLGHDPPASWDHEHVSVLPIPANASGGAAIHTMDYCPQIVSDTFLFGKIAALHALSDIHAMGAKPQTSLALVGAPFSSDKDVAESALLQLLSGVSDVLQDEGAQLVGFRTFDGCDTACALSILALADKSQRSIGKRGGDVVLTKPIGTGAMLAAHSQAKCRGNLLDEGLQVICTSNGTTGNLASHFDGVHACLAVSRFGLVGHLLEMLSADEHEPQSLGAVLRIEDIPFLQGGLESSSDGLFSAFQSRNAKGRQAISNDSAAKAFPVKYPLLFDPQTCGGLLVFVDQDDCDEFMWLLRTEKVSAAVIGELELVSSLKGGPGDNGGSDKCGIYARQRIRIHW